MGSNICVRYQVLYPKQVGRLVLCSLVGWEQFFDTDAWKKFSEFKQLLMLKI